MTWLTGHRRTAAAILAVAALLLAAGCGGGKSAEPPPLTLTPTTSASPSPSAKPAWAAKYTDQQYADFEAALKRYTGFQAHNNSFYNPPDPVKAKKVVDEYFNQDEGRYQLKVVRWARDHHLRSDNNVKVLWTKMTQYGHTMQGNPQVTMQQCVDARHVKISKNGELQPGNYKTPLIDQITMGQTPAADGSRWVISDLLDSGDAELGAVACHAE